MSAALLYRWPDAAAFGRVVPKTKFYEHGAVSNAVRERFVADVERITWAFKLAESTVRLRPATDVPEIQVFVIDAKHDDVTDSVLAAIDAAVQTQVIFEINANVAERPRTRMVAAPKQLTDKRPKLGAYYSGDWCDTDHERQALPTAVDLSAMYTALLAPLLPVPLRTGEAVGDAADRASEVGRIEREIAALNKRIRNEPQFNRQVELRRRVNEHTATLATLIEPSSSGGGV